jgi:hypothetical protein
LVLVNTCSILMTEQTVRKRLENTMLWSVLTRKWKLGFWAVWQSVWKIT